MTNSILNHKTLVTAGLIAFGALGFSSLGAHAGATDSLAQCKAFSREKVIKCCDTVIKQQGAPAWFRDNNMSCGNAVSCSGGSGGYDKVSYSVALVTKYRCWIPMYDYNNQGKQKENESRQRGKN